MSVDKIFCMSSYLAFRYIEDDNKDFYTGVPHQHIEHLSKKERIIVNSSLDIDNGIEQQIRKYSNVKKGIMLSGGMDSAILASYLSGSDAYTFRFENGEYQEEELKRAEFFANYYHLNLHYVDINWNTVENSIEKLMRHKGAPIHSIETQIYTAAIQAKNDGIELMIIGDGSDYRFGGMDKLLSKDWTFNQFVERYTYIKPKDVLKNSVNMNYLFERYRTGSDTIDYLSFLSDVSTDESFASYSNAFSTAGMKYYDPYERFCLAEKLDLQRIRNGESKYLIRELFKCKYPDVPVPEKLPMPRPVDIYFKHWAGPSRPEFQENLDLTQFTGNQKWQLWCLERFLSLYE